MFCKSVKCAFNHFRVSFAISLNCITHHILAFHRPSGSLEMYTVTSANHKSWPPPNLSGESTTEAPKERTHFCCIADIWEHLYPGLSFWPSSKVSKPKKVCSLCFSQKENGKEAVSFFVLCCCGCKTCIFPESFRGFLHLKIIDLFQTSFLSSALLISYGLLDYQVSLYLGFQNLAKYPGLYFMFWICSSTPHLFPSTHTCIHEHILLSSRTLF